MSREKAELRPLKFKRRLAYIDVDDISPNEKNPREPIAKKEVADILESIRTMGGVLVPIVVFKEGDKYILLDGERRWRACKKLTEQDRARVEPRISGDNPQIPIFLVADYLSPLIQSFIPSSSTVMVTGSGSWDLYLPVSSM